MKKLIYLGLLLFSVGMVQAQVKWTPEIGVNIITSNSTNTAYKATPRVGLGLDYFFNGEANKWGIGTGLYFYQTKEEGAGMFYTPKGGWTYFNSRTYFKDLNNTTVSEIEFIHSKSRSGHLQIPVMAKYKHDFNENIAIGIGIGGFAAYGFAEKGKNKLVKWSDDTNKFTSEESKFSYSPYYRWDAGFAGKVSLYAHQFVVNCGYELNLLHFNTQPKTHQFSFTVGYSF